jgi:putative phosphoesterase
MKIAFISDIHGNLTALKAVLTDMALQKPDQVICLGDILTMGPQPIEVLAELRKLNCIFIKGNHDAAVLNPELAEQYQITSYLTPDLLWCKEKLTKEDVEFLESFRPSYEFKFPNDISVLCFHGSPRSNTDLIQAITPAEKLDEFFAEQNATVFIGGHSHIQMHRRHGNKLILNSGSVGNAFKFAYTPGIVPSLLPWAEYAIISQNGDSLDIDMRRVYFNTDELLEIIKQSGLPGSQWWLKQYKE